MRPGPRCRVIASSGMETTHAGDPEVVVRNAVLEDAGRLAMLLDGGSLTVKEDPGDVASYREALSEILSSSGQEVLVAESGGEVVGMCQLIVFRHVQHRGGRCAEIESVHVDQAWRRRGVGSTLMSEAVRRARDAGCYRVQLTSNAARVDAHRWYLRLGFDASHVGFKLYLDAAGIAPLRPEG